MKRNLLTLLLLLLCLPALLLGAQNTGGVDNDGFVRSWLVLGPIPSEGEDSGYAEVDKEQIKGEAGVKPKEGEKVTVGGKELTWKKVATPDYYIDFKELVGQAQSEDVVGYAVAYITSETEQNGLKLKIGSNDQAKIYLNGKPVVKVEEGRTLTKDETTVDNITLNKGLNVVVFKVINEKNNWQGCLRFTDKNGAPIKNLKVSTSAS